jgi:hypothetical protein
MTDESLPLPCYKLLDAIDEAGYGGVLVDRIRADPRYSQDAERYCREKKLIRVGSYQATGSAWRPYALTFNVPDIVFLTSDGEIALTAWRLRSKDAARPAEFSRAFNKLRNGVALLVANGLPLRHEEPAAPEAAGGAAAGQDAKPAAGNQLSQACPGTEYVRLIRIFVSSPGDVQAERDILEKAVAQINRTDGYELGVMLQTFQWEKDVIPQIGPPAQKVVNEQTPDCGIYVGIMSARFGTRTEDFGSGTEEEFQDAVKRWGARGKPWILFYFDKNPPSPKTSEDTSQFRKVVRFRKKIQKMGITGTYESVDKGENSLFFQALTHLRKVAAIIGKDPGSPSCPV